MACDKHRESGRVMIDWGPLHEKSMDGVHDPILHPYNGRHHVILTLRSAFRQKM